MARTALSLIAFACLSIGALASNKEKKTVRKVEIDVHDRMAVDSCIEGDADYCLDVWNLQMWVIVSDDPGKLYEVECGCVTDRTCLIWAAPFYSGEIRGKWMRVTARGSYDETQISKITPLKKPGRCLIDGYSGEGERRFRREAERRSGAKVNSSRSEATLA